MYNRLYERKNFLGCSIKRETGQLEKKKTKDGKILFKKALVNGFWLTSESCSWFYKVVTKIVLDVQFVKKVHLEMVIGQQSRGA